MFKKICVGGIRLERPKHLNRITKLSSLAPPPEMGKNHLENVILCNFVDNQKYASDPRPPHTRQTYEQKSGQNMTPNATKQGKFGSLGPYFCSYFCLLCEGGGGAWFQKESPDNVSVFFPSFRGGAREGNFESCPSFSGFSTFGGVSLDLPRASGVPRPGPTKTTRNVRSSWKVVQSRGNQGKPPCESWLAFLTLEP